MICEECKKKSATVYINQIFGNKTRSRAICEDCAEKTNFDSAADKSSLASNANEAASLRCPICHTALSAFENSKNLTLGCPECYSHFEKEISRSLRFRRGQLVYCGRVPLRLRQEAKKAEYLTKLRSEMADAVAGEDFERALTIREMIKCVL